MPDGVPDFRSYRANLGEYRFYTRLPEIGVRCGLNFIPVPYHRIVEPPEPCYALADTRAGNLPLMLLLEFKYSPDSGLRVIVLCLRHLFSILVVRNYRNPVKRPKLLSHGHFSLSSEQDPSESPSL
jgi:hypothetical protein